MCLHSSLETYQLTLTLILGEGVNYLTLTSETKNIYLDLYIDLGKWVADLGKWVAGYELSMGIAVRENDSWSMFWPRLICPGHGDRDHDQRIILEFDVSRGGGQRSRRNVPGRFLRTKSINESSLTSQHVCVFNSRHKENSDEATLELPVVNFLQLSFRKYSGSKMEPVIRNMA